MNTPLIKVKVVLEDKLEVQGTYDPGSQVSLINAKLVRIKEKKNDVNKIYLKSVNGVGTTKGLITIKVKIFDIEKEMDVYIIEEEDFIIGLDMIKLFKLTENEKLEISQKKETDIINIGIKTEINNTDDENDNSKIKQYSVNFNEHIKENEFS